ncbi:MAG: hypothetical protein NC923_06680 [Candidatus Omnitrophica bacterium]|nr:hypothetical protein [Candidatus Omnitrophota bacterium]
MKRWLLVIIGISFMFFLSFALSKRTCPITSSKKHKTPAIAIPVLSQQAMLLLRKREDNAAFLIFGKILEQSPKDINALWGKAEVFRRKRKYKESEEILQEILKIDPLHAPSLISLAYIRYKDSQLQEAARILDNLLSNKLLDSENRAMAYLLLSAVNSSYSLKGGILTKMKTASKILYYLSQARDLAPELPETHLGLGTFYLKSPAILGGNLNKAIRELEYCLILAPHFATAHARLAQAYGRKGDIGRYEFHLEQAKTLDPQNEVLQEL